jgi:hypothetical protein
MGRRIKNMVNLTALLSFLVLTSPQAEAADDSQAHFLVQRAITAAGGQSALESLPAIHAKTEGQTASGVLFKEETFHQPPGMLKQVQQLDSGSKHSEIILVVAGENGWLRANQKTVRLGGFLFSELREAANVANATRLLPLLTGDYRLSPLPPARIAGRLVKGIGVSRCDYRDINLYFDAETMLLAKIEHKVWDITTNQAITEERYLMDYRPVQGIQTAHAIRIDRNAKPYLEARSMLVEHLRAIDKPVFAQP